MTQSAEMTGRKARRAGIARRSLIVVVALLALIALTSLAAQAGAAKKKGAAARATISKVTVDGKEVTVIGKVTLPVGTATSKAKVAISLLDNSGDVEQFKAKVDAKRKFKATETTKLTGQLIVVASVKIGKKTGREVRRRFAGPSASIPNNLGADAGTGPPKGTPLIGLFKLDPGNQALSGKISGTYFRMIGAGSPVTNFDSPFGDKTYTPLSAGTDGGLSTVFYQPPPSPAFSGINTGDCLASRIVQPQKFFGTNFSVVTDSIDRPTGKPTSVPVILNDNGTLSGQITAWNPCYSGEYFTQGSPDPDGNYGGTWNYSGTTPLTGTYDAATRHYQITWQGLIVTGGFSGFTGQWFLEGTFVPAQP